MQQTELHKDYLVLKAGNPSATPEKAALKLGVTEKRIQKLHDDLDSAGLLEQSSGISRRAEDTIVNAATNKGVPTAQYSYVAKGRRNSNEPKQEPGVPEEIASQVLASVYGNTIGAVLKVYDARLMNLDFEASRKTGHCVSIPGASPETADQWATCGLIPFKIWFAGIPEIDEQKVCLGLVLLSLREMSGETTCGK